MPLEAVAINSFDAPIMRETKSPDELRERITKLYADYPASQPDLPTDEPLAVFEQAFRKGGLLYVGMFNDKPICVVGVFDDGQTDTKRLEYLAVHPENKGRNIEGKFIKQVYDAEVKKGVKQFMPVDTEIHRIMSEYEMLTARAWH